MKKIVYSILTTLLFMLPYLIGNSAIYYIATDGNDTTGDGTYATPWKTFTKANPYVVDGGTIVYKNGTYDYANSNIVDPSSGSPSGYTCIVAETAGSVTIDGGSSYSCINISGSATYRPQYIIVDGFKCINAGGEQNVLVRGANDGAKAQHVYIRNTGARDADGLNEAIWSLGAYAINCWFEQCWAWGVSRVHFLIYGYYPEAGAPHTSECGVIRCVSRIDGTLTGAAGSNNYIIYGASQCYIINCIAIDNNNANDPEGSFRHRSGYTFNSKLYGNMSVNVSSYTHYSIDGTSTTLENNVGWDNVDTYAMTMTQNPITNMNHMTLKGGLTAVGYTNSATNISIKNSLYIGPDDGQGGNYTHYDCDNGAMSGVSPSSGTPNMDYICRIESDSPCKDTGSPSGDRGANILYKYNKDLTLSADSLWPFPNEDRIKTDFSESYAYFGNVPATSTQTRGFCDPSVSSLTEYIWEYEFGNPNPYAESGSESPGRKYVPPISSTLIRGKRK